MAEDTNNTTDLSTRSKQVNLRFVLSNGLTPETCPSVLLEAYQQCEENGHHPEWIEEESVMQISNPLKTDIFVIEPFEGLAFDYVSQNNFKCVVIGPRCLTYCILHKKSIPEFTHPMHNMAMYKLVITCTGFNQEEKLQIKKLVQYMAGIFSSDFNLSVTHLIANSIDTDKYRVAQEREKPIMKASWVDAVWKSVGGTGISATGVEESAATDQRFLSHVCPVFYQQVVCVSQFPKKDKNTIKKLVEENGGRYSATLEMDDTTLLVILSPEGEKYKAATNWKKKIVNPDYIYDSVQAGYALNPLNYKVKERGSSTPTKGNLMLHHPDLSNCSSIGNETLISCGPPVKVNETAQADNTLMAVGPSGKPSGPITNDKIIAGVDALDAVSVSSLKRAPLTLDGCKVYLSGWAEGGASIGGARAEKLRRLLNMSGATRFNQLAETATHVILGSYQGDTLSTVKAWVEKPYLVNAEWLIDSLKHSRHMEESPYICIYDKPEEKNSSPKISGKRLSQQKLSMNDTTIDFSGKTFPAASSEDLLKKYCKPSRSTEMMPPPPPLSPVAECSVTADQSINCSTIVSSQASQLPIFAGLTFLISGYDESILAELHDSLLRFSATVIMPEDYDGTSAVDYCLLTMEGEGMLARNAAHYVTHIYVEDCSQEEKVVDVEYYHIPLVLRNTMPRPLENVVVAISSYVGRERLFLEVLSQKLGAYFQEVFARKDNAAKGVRGCTHLICMSNTGDKYNASVKWKIPAVTKHWLFACLQQSEEVDIQNYRPGDKKSLEVDILPVLLNLIERQSPPLVQVENLDETDNTIASTPAQPALRSLRKMVALRGAGASMTNVCFTTPGKPTTPSAIQTPDTETLRRLYPTPGRNDSIDNMPTPNTPYGITWEENPSKRTRKAFKRMLERLPENDYGRMVKRQKIRDIQLHEMNKRMADNVIKVLGYDPDVESDKEQREPNARDDTQSKARLPLAGCVVYISKKLEHLQKDLCNKVSSLGGEIRWNFCSPVTHVVFDGKANENNKDLKAAKEAGKIIVSSGWINSCHTAQMRLDECNFPYSYNPNRSLNVVSERVSDSEAGGPNMSNDKNASSSDDEEEISIKHNSHNSDSTNNQKFVEDTKDDNSQVERELAELEKLAANTETQQTCESDEIALMKGGRTKLAGTTNTTPLLGMKRSRSSIRKSSGNRVDVQDLPIIPTIGSMDMIGSQATNIGWSDPVDSEARRRLTTTDEAVDDAAVTEEEEESPPKWQFVVAQMDEDSEREAREIIEELGGTLMLQVTPEMTHLVTRKTVRTEKVLTAIALGRWVLTPAYLQECRRAGRFVEEEPFEWGNPAVAKPLPPIPVNGLENALSYAANRWRIRKGGAYANWHALLVTSKKKMEPFSRVLLAGGAKVSTEQVSETNFPSSVTHCLVDLQFALKFDLALFASRKVPCLEPTYLCDYLAYDPPPDPFEACIKPYKEILHNLQS